MVGKPRRVRRGRETSSCGSSGEAGAQAGPVRYSRAIADRICERLAAGHPWTRICQEADMPSQGTLFRWTQSNASFRERVKAARDAGVDFLSDEAVRVAEGASKETLQQDRLRVAALLKRAALIAPRAGKGEAPAKVKPEPQVVVFRVRRFTRVVAPDGTVSVVEAAPEDA